MSVRICLPGRGQSSAGQAAFEKAMQLDRAAPMSKLGLGIARIREGCLQEEGHRFLTRSYPSDHIQDTHSGQKKITMNRMMFSVIHPLCYLNLAMP